jgi:hypothetical protein
MRDTVNRHFQPEVSIHIIHQLSNVFLKKIDESCGILIVLRQYYNIAKIYPRLMFKVEISMVKIWKIKILKKNNIHLRYVYFLMATRSTAKKSLRRIKNYGTTKIYDFRARHSKHYWVKSIKNNFNLIKAHS